MRLVLFTDDMFNRSLAYEDYKYYLEKKNVVWYMLHDQPLSYWLQFTISFHAFLYERGLIPWMDKRRMYCEQSSMALLDIIMIDNIIIRKKKLDQLFEDLRLAHKYNAEVAELGQDPSFFFQKSAFASSLSRLFGSIVDIPKKIDTLNVYSKFAGALLECRKRWEYARTCESREMFPWDVPIHWTDPSKYRRVYLFERHLKQKFGKKLSHMLNIPIESIVWWNEVEKMDILDHASCLPEYIGKPFLPSYSPLYPWGEDQDRGEVELPTQQNCCSHDDSTSKFDHLETLAEQEMSVTQDQHLFKKFENMSFRKSGVGLDQTKVGSRTGLIRIPRLCCTCKDPEPHIGAFKNCKKCLDEHVPQPALYCGHKCQEIDWNRQHKTAHKLLKAAMKKK